MRKTVDYLGQVVNYIRKNLKKGYTKESLRWALVNQGHSRIEIDKAFKRTEQEMAREAPVLKTKPIIKYEIIEPKIENIKLKKRHFWNKWIG
ncbi:MAG: hypothetical protein IIA87_02340 [Nanoarchaeota archaeon]|nr:hypothetical protein [Nanoarchaeota archaeon]